MASSQFTPILQSLKKILSEGFDEESNLKLNELFDSVKQLRDLMEDSDLPSHNSKQDALQISIKSLEKCTLMVNELELFSSNETTEDLQTSSIKFLLIPALLGSLNLSIENKNLSERKRYLEMSEVYFKDFLLRCANYEVCRNAVQYFSSEIANNEENRSFVSDDPSLTRERKIQQYRKKKELLDREKLLEPALKRGDSEEYTREYYLVILERWAIIAMEELEYISKEKDILKSMPKTDKLHRNGLPEKKAESKPLKPFILTKTAAQKQVFGLGYPSIPVLTIDDFYRQRFEKALEEQKQERIEEQILNKNKKSLQDAAISGEGLKTEEEEIEKEKLAENDDFASLVKARQWDEWKDDNPRGSGNRYNKG